MSSKTEAEQGGERETFRRPEGKTRKESFFPPGLANKCAFCSLVCFTLLDFDDEAARVGKVFVLCSQNRDSDQVIRSIWPHGRKVQHVRG